MWVVYKSLVLQEEEVAAKVFYKNNKKKISTFFSGSHKPPVLSPLWRSQTPPRSHSLPSSFKVNVAQPNTPIVVKVQRHVMFLTIPIQYMQYLVWLNGNQDFSISSTDRNRYCDKNWSENLKNICKKVRNGVLVRSTWFSFLHVTPWNCVKVMKVTLDQTRTTTMAS
jgi:hypothetical protein